MGEILTLSRAVSRKAACPFPRLTPFLLGPNSPDVSRLSCCCCRDGSERARLLFGRLGHPRHPHRRPRLRLTPKAEKIQGTHFEQFQLRRHPRSRIAERPANQTGPDQTVLAADEPSRSGLRAGSWEGWGLLTDSCLSAGIEGLAAGLHIEIRATTAPNIAPVFLGSRTRSRPYCSTMDSVHYKEPSVLRLPCRSVLGT